MKSYNFTYGKKKSKNKYGAKKTTVDDIVFDSKKEANYYSQLKYRVRQKEIEELQLQVRYPINGKNGAKICTYIADFVFFDNDEDRYRVIDVKGFKTDVYKLKKKLFEDFYQMPLEEV